MSSYLKNLYQIAALVSMAAFLFSCGDSKPGNKIEKLSIDSSKSKKKIEVEFIGQVMTRRTFADIQFMEDEKKIERYTAKQEESSPDIIMPDTFLTRQFERVGLIRNGELSEKNPRFVLKEIFDFKDSADRALQIRFSFGSNRVKVFFATDSVEIKVEPYPNLIKYALLDIIPGGNKELVIQNNWYIMNGYNFDYMVYRIKSY